MLGHVIEGLRTLPSKKSLVVKRVRAAIPAARRYMFNHMPSNLLLIVVRHMGYVAVRRGDIILSPAVERPARSD